ncbi:ABC transporter [Synechococcus sp. PROS-7-1]|nr:ABC transporter [Synechococcus sp. PROS-7-1]
MMQSNPENLGWGDPADIMQKIVKDPVLCLGMSALEEDAVMHQIESLNHADSSKCLTFMESKIKILVIKFDRQPIFKSLASLPMKILVINKKDSKWCYINSYQRYKLFLQQDYQVCENCNFFSLVSSLPQRKLSKLELSWWQITARWKSYVLSLVGLSIFTLLSTLPVLAMGPIFDQLIPTGQINQLIIICIGLFTSQLIGTLFKTVSTVSITFAQSSIDFHGLISLVNRYLAAKPSALPSLSLSLWEQNFKTALAFTSSARALLISIPIALLTIGTYMVVFGFYLLEPRIVFLILLLSSLPAWVSLVSGYITGRISFQLIRNQAENNQIIIDTVRYINEIRSMGLEALFDQSFTNTKNRYYKMIRSVNQWSSYGVLFSRIVSSLLVALILFAYSTTTGISQGKYLVMFTAFSFISSGFSQVAEAISSLMIALPTYFSKNSLRGLEQFEHLRLSWQPSSPMDPFEPIQSIELKQIAYKHTNTKYNIISNLNLIFEKGRKYAITGEPGSGKSTLIKVLGGIHDASEGDIIINNTLLSHKQSIKNFARIMVIPQSPKLFGATIREFLDPWNHHPDDEIIEALNNCACKQIFKGLPMGLQTNLSESSQDLSNAELQRLHITRVVLGQPTVLLSDEPTSYLDEESHLSLLNKLHQSCSIHISCLHRLSAEDSFNEVIRLETQNKYLDQES